jgi:peptide deformylase
MSILKVARLGHPVLRTPSRALTPAELQSSEIQRLIDDMIETMYEYDGVGLAAPQIHIGLRLAVLEVPDTDDRAREAVPLTVLVNPEIQPLADQKATGWEGCLSIPELRGEVPRWTHLSLSALDRDGTPYTVEARGFHARVIQHECDHLDGNVYLDRMSGLRSLAYQHELERHSVPENGD